MNFENKHPSDADWESDRASRDRLRAEKRLAIISMAGTGLVIAAWLFLLFGCVSTTVPQRVEASQASFDGGAQNSGIILSTATGFVVTTHFRERYNAMIAVYGGDFVPPLKPDAGIAPIGEDRWLISKEGMVRFVEMNTWRKSGLNPKNP
jgi:hypothetical protein